MKDCCKTGYEKPDKRGIKKWFNYIIYGLVASIVIWAVIVQLTDKN